MHMALGTMTTATSPLQVVSKWEKGGKEGGLCSWLLTPKEKPNKGISRDPGFRSAALSARYHPNPQSAPVKHISAPKSFSTPSNPVQSFTAPLQSTWRPVRTRTTPNLRRILLRLQLLRRPHCQRPGQTGNHRRLRHLKSQLIRPRRPSRYPCGTHIHNHHHSPANTRDQPRQLGRGPTPMLAIHLPQSRWGPLPSRLPGPQRRDQCQ